MKYYVGKFEGLVHPVILSSALGTVEQQGIFAREYHSSDKFNEENDCLFWLDIDDGGNPAVGSYTAGAFMD